MREPTGSEWRARALKAEAEVARLYPFEMREIGARIMARRFWNALKARTGLEAEALFDPDVLRIVDPAFDAAETVWEKHHITVVPCRLPWEGGCDDTYLGRWPDGSTRNLTREQLLMMGGQDVEAAA